MIVILIQLAFFQSIITVTVCCILFGFGSWAGCDSRRSQTALYAWLQTAST